MRSRRLLALAGTGWAAMLPLSLSAQETQDTTRLRELVVTATRLPTPPDGLVSSVTTISGEDLRARGIRFVQDALREVPGATVVQSGSYGGITSLFLRGGESDYVKVLIDGVPVNQSGGGYDWANLSADNVERIEVLRGPGSVLYGSDAVSGVVQVFTRRGQGRTAIEGRAEAGTFGTIDGQLGVSGGGEALSYSAQAGRFSSDGVYAFNNDYGNTVLSGSLASQLDSRSDGSLSVRYTDTRYHFPTDFAGVPSDSNQSNAEQALSLGGEIGRRLGSATRFRLSFGGSHSDREFDDLPDNAGDTVGFAFASHRDTRAQRGNLDGRVDAKLGPGLTVTSGVQVEHETERQSGETTSNFGGTVTTPDTPFDRGRTTLGYYAQAVAEIASRLSVNANARIDDNSAFGTFLTYRAGAAFQLLPGARIRASVGRAFKAPTFCEQFCDAPFLVGDSTLNPERSTSWEVGAEYVVGTTGATIWATYFDQHFKDMVVYDGAAGPGEPTYRNGAAAKAGGLEAGVAVGLAPGLRASASYTYLSAEATDDAGVSSPSFAEGEPLIRRPKHSAELALTARLVDRVTLGGALSYVGRRDDVDFSSFPGGRVRLPAYALVDLNGEIELLRASGTRPGIAGVLRVENLFDERYDQVLGFPGRSRGVFGGMRVKY